MPKVSTKAEMSFELIKGYDSFINLIIAGCVEKNDVTRQFVLDLDNPEISYYYATCIDTEPRDDTRTLCCKDPVYASDYANFVDNGPRDDTRESACRDPFTAFCYAVKVDGKFHEKTWKAVENDQKWVKLYTKYIFDKEDF